MNIIAAADLNWGIGKDGDLLDSIPEDMKFFREKTSGCAVIMGKNTFLSFPNQKPLPKRLNIVLTSDETFKPEGVTVCRSMEEAVEAAKKEYEDEKIFFIGGESVYREAEKFADTAYITKIDKKYEADRFLLNFDEIENWYVSNEEMVKTEKGIYITFVTYKKER
ncbi:MAG: dihydrofolate reductase [Ruminococcaceae bacterium]|nr:dihydrofolate reductase [Oscillospiraceae bacterium]